MINLTALYIPFSLQLGVYTKFTINLNSVMNGNKNHLQKDYTMSIIMMHTNETEESGRPIYTIN